MQNMMAETTLFPLSLTGLTQLLNAQFLADYNTVLRGGFEEPFYLAPRQGRPAEIRFTRDYYRSALHELAHWCVAGEARRNIDDFGYWYAPDGRTQEQQEAFFKVEVQPQAIEWALSLVCGVKFDVSVDNLSNSVSGADAFKQTVREQLAAHLNSAFPARTEALLQFIYDSRVGGQAGSVYRFLQTLHQAGFNETALNRAS
ncbi:MAG: elongation factor P hydroxylase [Gammaproteobacteria bacterium]